MISQARRRTTRTIGTVLLVGTLALGALDGAAPTSAAPLPAWSADRASSATTGGAGAGDPYWPRDGNSGFDVRHYGISVDYDFATGVLTGTTRIALVPGRRLASFHLDLLLPVTSVRVDGAPAAVRRPDRHEIVITPSAPLPPGRRSTVEVRYRGRPAAYGYAGERNWLANTHEVVAMNEPHMAPWWFAGSDHPTDKARFDIRVTGPASYRAVAGGLPVRRTTAGERATTHWRSTRPMATYLAFFALGRFRVERTSSHGLPSIIAVSQALPAHHRRTSLRLLRRSGAITHWLAQRLGRYPFESTGGLATSLNVGFALENQTRPTYPGGLEDLATYVHELAHQWFGDSVSVRRWRHIWLNEGFATFMEKYWTERHHGVPARNWLAGQYRYARNDPWFWQLRIADPGPRHVFDNPVYERGAMALQALRNRVGERTFWRIVRTWVRTHRYGNAGTGEFERLAERISGERLDGFFDAWLRARRAPADTRANGLGSALR